MKKFIILLVTLIFFTSNVYQAQAQERTALPSAQLQTTIPVNGLLGADSRVVAIQKIFKKYNSPLGPYAPFYVEYADKYNIDWKLLPAISGLESYFGTMLIPGTYNAYGWGGGYIYFKSWEDGIAAVTKSLREDYMNKWGAKTVWDIGPIYAEAPHWSTRVSAFMDEISNEYVQLTSTPSKLLNL